jgi:hypothetical protein
MPRAVCAQKPSGAWRPAHAIHGKADKAANGSAGRLKSVVCRGKPEASRDLRREFNGVRRRFSDRLNKMRPAERRGARQYRERCSRPEGSLAIFLDPCGPQTGQSVPVDGPLPAQEFIHRQLVPLAGLFHREESATHGRHDFRFSADHPPLCIPRREIGDSQRTTVGSNDVARTRSVRLLAHSTLHTLTDQVARLRDRD